MSRCLSMIHVWCTIFFTSYLLILQAWPCAKREKRQKNRASNELHTNATQVVLLLFFLFFCFFFCRFFLLTLHIEMLAIKYKCSLQALEQTDTRQVINLNVWKRIECTHCRRPTKENTHRLHNTGVYSGVATNEDHQTREEEADRKEHRQALPDTLGSVQQVERPLRYHSWYRWGTRWDEDELLL